MLLDGSTTPLRGLDDLALLERTPFAERVSAQSTYDLLRAGAALDPARVAISALRSGDPQETPEEVSFAELLRRVTQAAHLFARLGVGPHDAVACLLPSIPETHFVIWGASAAGVACPINPLIESAHMLELLVASGAKVVVAPAPELDAAVYAKAVDAVARMPQRPALLTAGGAAPAEALDLLAALDAESGDRLALARTISRDDVAAYFHTGGTTGAPKLAAQTHGNQIYQAWALALHCDIRPRDTVIVGLPLFHNSALINMGLTPFAAGASIVLPAPGGFRHRPVVQKFWRLVERYRATFFIAVPTVWASLSEIPLDGADVSSLRYGLSGAAPAPPDIIERTERLTGITILEAYGLTEATCGAACNPRNGAKKRGSIGQRFAYEEMKTAIVNEAGEVLRDCADDEVGSLLIRGPMVFRGYLNPAHNAKAFTRDGWLNTGDLARRDRDGYFWITGRAKDIIIRGGHNIEPAMIEDCLHIHPAVSIAAAVGRPDAYAGELPVAYVKLRDGASVADGELVAFARARIAERAAAPVEVYVVDDIPLTAVGKIFKPPLRRDAAKRGLEQLLAGKGLISSVAIEDDATRGTRAVVKADAKDWPMVEAALKDLPLAFELRPA